MIDFSRVKLGKSPALIDPRTLRLSRYLTSALPPAPLATDYTGGVTQFGMMLNGPNDGRVAPKSGLGDCTIAACGHGEQIWSIAANGVSSEYTPPDIVILHKYEQWCGYVLGDPSTDQGGVEISVLNDWRKNGLHPHRHRHKVIGYADPNPLNIEEICQAITLFGFVYIGLQLPISAQTQGTWDVSTGPNSIPGSWGGHAVVVPKYRTVNGKRIFTAISWGEPFDITEDFWTYRDSRYGSYVDEAHAIASNEFLSLKTGDTPSGFDLAQMESDLAYL